MNDLWPKFIERSIIKHMLQYTEVNWQVTGDDDKTSDTNTYCELRTDGPWIEQRGRNVFHAEFEINVLISIADPDIYSIKEIGGKIMQLLVKPIVILDDNQNSIGDCATPMYDRRNKLQFNNFGRIAVDTNIEQATIETRYHVELQGD